jgi:hypothetical protein
MANEFEQDVEAFKTASSEFVVALCSLDTSDFDVVMAGVDAVLAAMTAIPPTNTAGGRKAIERLRRIAALPGPIR